MPPYKRSSTPMVGEACAYVQDESLKAPEVFLRRLSNSPITRGKGMLTAAELTLMFAAMMSALGLERSALIYRHTGNRHYWYGAWAQALMTLWCLAIAIGVLLQAVR